MNLTPHSPQEGVTPMFGLALLCGLQPQQLPLPFEQVTEVHGPKANPLSAIPKLPTFETQSQSILEPKALPQSVLGPLQAKYAPLVRRVLARLSEAEQHEVNTHLKQDYRQAWICVSFASKNSTQPFVESSYACYGVHPSKVWERILAERHSRLGAEYHDWFDSNDCLRPDVPKFTPPPVKEVEPNERIEALMSAPSLPPSKGATGAGLGTAGPALQPNDKERKPA